MYGRKLAADSQQNNISDDDATDDEELRQVSLASDEANQQTQ
jgi:hypothetical protein